MSFKMLFAVTGVSAEWVDDGFTSLRVTVQEEGLYRISYSAVNKRNATEPKIITTTSNSHVLNDLRPNCFYTIMVKAVSLDSSEAENGSIGVGEQLHYYTCLLFSRLLCMPTFLCTIFYSLTAGLQELGLPLLLRLLLPSYLYL